jgi:hypothetical protein
MKQSNEMYDSEAPYIRRTLKIADFENITFGYPLLNLSNNPLINFWATVEFIDTQLAEWANHIAAGHQHNIGKGPIDRLLTEIQFARQKLVELNAQENK